ncbi:MAG: hypothetical protein WD737_02450 [Gemmatimonadota bacterium]
MRFLLFLLVLVPMTGCLDAVGLGGSCTLEMRNVQRQEGTPDSTNGPRELTDGNFEELWQYDASAGEPAQVYRFRWGVSYEGCQVTGPVPLDLIPALLT